MWEKYTDFGGEHFDSRFHFGRFNVFLKIWCRDMTVSVAKRLVAKGFAARNPAGEKKVLFPQKVKEVPLL